MRKRHLGFGLISTLFAVGLRAVCAAQPTKVIELVGQDGVTSVAVIRVSAQNALLESPKSPETYLMTPEAMFAIRHQDRTYRADRLDELRAALKRKVDEIAASRGRSGIESAIEFRVTEQIDTISGWRARRIMKLRNEKPEEDIWASSDLMPAALRAAWDSLWAGMPPDYWTKVNGEPGLPELILLYGVPLRILDRDGQTVVQARVRDDQGSSTSFEVPAGYRKLP